jgi:ElaB/YqjD/DUF883 family membrane-anchored ribosome-binding protein
MVSARSTASADLRRDIDALKDDISTLKVDLVAAMRDMVDAGKSEAGDAKERLESAVRDRLDKLGDTAKEAAARGRRAVESAERYVEDNPLQSLAVAFGVGVLLGAVLRR